MNFIDKIKNKIDDFYTKKYFQHQRAKQGYCNRDLFEIGTWFLEIMPRMLDEFLKYSHAMSKTVIEDYYNKHKEEIDKRKIENPYFITDKLTDKEFDSLVKKWDEIIIEMKNCFLNALPSTCDYVNKYEKEYDEKYEEFQKNHPLDKKTVKEKGRLIASVDIPDFNKVYKELSSNYIKEEIKKDEYREANRVRGMKLFTKYMNDLID